MKRLWEIICRFFMRAKPVTIPVTVPPSPTLPETHSLPPVERRETPSEYETMKAQRLYEAAKGYLGIDLTPLDEVPDFVACVASIQELFRRVFGRYVGKGAALVNTRALRDALQKDAGFVPVAWDDAKPGDVCVFATGESSVVHHGHVFVVGKRDWMSNNSANGWWEAHKTKQQVEDYYVTYARFTPYVFRPR